MVEAIEWASFCVFTYFEQIKSRKYVPVPGSMMFADDIVLCGDDETDMTEYLETWRKALEERGMRISRPKTQFMDLALDRIMAKKESRLRSQRKRYKECIILSTSVQRGRDWRNGNRKYKESERSMDKLEEMQWSVVGQDDASGTKGKGLQNCGHTSSVVWYRDMGNNEGTRSTTRSKWDEDADMDMRSDKDRYYPKWTH